ncbi:hypothetical protein PMY56_03600 [Clostridium tertium]|uniref:hypothetical protein n=1 Tax=Clostridium tertium TaxID=1559 RepID=UPI00232C038E|nr:hypothetical protein [Clostridium tertium]MDB1921088.1 hypothetical protein [Clostridium tertium]MDB1925214.1 hypothetical protein [Clostridium tertium]MDB1930300.1 hypothetical protein [Clostridium tertium]
MSRNKFNLKDKKTKIVIGGTIIIVLLLFIGIGLGLSSMNNTDSKNIATQGQDKTDKKEENKKEENKKEESNSSDSTKVEGTNTSTENDKVASNEETSSSGSSSSGSSSGSGSSSSNNNVVAPPSNGSGSSSGSSNGGGTSNPPANSHSHSWNPIYDTIHHEEVGHYETVVIKDAWTEEIPIYEEQERLICNGCGKDITSDPYAHLDEQMLAGNMKCSGFSTDYRQVQVGTEEVKHGPVYDKKYVVDKAAWDETVTTGYQCSCGATK